jgi:hypothetical protein
MSNKKSPCKIWLKSGAPRVGVSPSTQNFSSKILVWTPPHYLASLLDMFRRSIPARTTRRRRTPRSKTKGPKRASCCFAPRVGIEPTTERLTVACSTAELPRNDWYAHGSGDGSHKTSQNLFILAENGNWATPQLAHRCSLVYCTHTPNLTLYAHFVC